MLQIKIRPYYRNKFSQENLHSAADQALKRCQPKDAIVSILITGDAEIQELNRQYRSMDKPTDVLSFNANYIDPESGLEYLGDIIISVPQAKKQAAVRGHTTDQEIQLLVIHGILHLSGYDHDTPQRQKKMWMLQSEILKELNNPLSDTFQVT
jgi:probable rRNA maturation factor